MREKHRRPSTNESGENCFTFINHPGSHIPGSRDITGPLATIDIGLRTQAELLHFAHIVRIKLGVETDRETNYN